MTKRHRRCSLLLITSAVCLSPLFGQIDENALRDKFGPPINRVFQVRPNINLSVTHGENHEICKLELLPTRNAAVIPASLIEELLNEIVSPSTRGTQRLSGMMCVGLCWGVIEYDAIIIRQTGTDVMPDRRSKAQNPLAVVVVKACQAAK